MYRLQKFLICLQICVPLACAQQYTISTYAGPTDATINVPLNTPLGVAVDSGGSLYIADTSNHLIRKISTSGIATTIAGTGVSGYSGDQGPATSAQLAAPSSVTVDPAGNVYIGDEGNLVIRKVSAEGIITTFAGGGTSTACSTVSSPATTVQLGGILSGLAADRAGNIYISDPFNNCIREVSPAGMITTYAGIGLYGFTGYYGFPTFQRLASPGGVAFDSVGNFYIADTWNCRVPTVWTKSRYRVRIPQYPW